MDASEWHPIAERIAATYPGADFGAERRAEYLDALRALPAAEVSRAVDHLLTEARSGPPSAPVIRQAVRRAGDPAVRSRGVDAASAARRAQISALAFISSAVSALALAGIGIWWLWSGR